MSDELLSRIAAKLETAIEDEDLNYCYASYGADVCVKNARGLVLLVLSGLLEPSAEMIDAGHELCGDPCWPEDYAKAFKASLQVLLAGKAP